MAVQIVKYVIIFLAVFNFGFMLLDGLRAMVRGDYMRPKKGQYAGQLGPWHRLVRALGIDPLSGLMKAIFVIWGITGLAITVYFGLYGGNAWKALLVMDILSLWYLWAGTMSCVLQIILLVMLQCIS